MRRKTIVLRQINGFPFKSLDVEEGMSTVEMDTSIHTPSLSHMDRRLWKTIVTLGATTSVWDTENKCKRTLLPATCVYTIPNKTGQVIQLSNGSWRRLQKPDPVLATARDRRCYDNRGHTPSVILICSNTAFLSS